MNYYQFHIGDYTTATAHLSMMEDLAYRRLIDLYYLNGHAICGSPETIARRIRMQGEESAVIQVLREFFDNLENEHTWVNKRCDEEIAAYETKAEVARANGAKGGRPPKTGQKPSCSPGETNRVILANPIETGSKANQEPITNNQVNTPLPPKGERPCWWDGRDDLPAKIGQAIDNAKRKNGNRYFPEPSSEPECAKVAAKVFDPGGGDVADELVLFREWCSRQVTPRRSDPYATLRNWLTKREADWRRLKAARDRAGSAKSPPDTSEGLGLRRVGA